MMVCDNVNHLLGTGKKNGDSGNVLLDQNFFNDMNASPIMSPIR